MRFLPAPTQFLVSEVVRQTQERRSARLTSTYSLYFDAGIATYFIVADDMEEASNSEYSTYTHRVMTLDDFAKLTPERHAAALEAIRVHKQGSSKPR